jgi:dynein heavy chain 1
MDAQLPQLQAKIMQENNVLSKKIESIVIEWDSAKPLQGQSPKIALEQITVFDTKLNLLAQDTNKMEAARKALNLVSRNSGSENVEIIERTMQELNGLREAWEFLAATWIRVEELKETLWSAVQPRKLRKLLDELMDTLKGLPARVQQYEAFDNFVQTVQSYKTTNLLLTELKVCCVYQLTSAIHMIW